MLSGIAPYGLLRGGGVRTRVTNHARPESANKTEDAECFRPTFAEAGEASRVFECLELSKGQRATHVGYPLLLGDAVHGSLHETELGDIAL